MAVRKLVLLGCLAVISALRTSDTSVYALEQPPKTDGYQQRFLHDAETPWEDIDTHHRAKRGIRRGHGHVISSFRHIPGKALDVATTIVSDIRMKDCAVYCVSLPCKAWSHNNVTNKCRFVGVKEEYVAVPVVQPHSDYYEISPLNVGGALYTILFGGGAADHEIHVAPSQVRQIDDPLSTENVLTDYLEPLPTPSPSPTPAPTPSPAPVTPPPDQPVTDPPTPAPTPPPTDAPTPEPDLSYEFPFPDHCGVRPTFGLSDYERLLAPPGQMTRTRVVGGTPVATGTYPWQAQIQISNNRGYEHSCGGIIISNDLILTAAHCHIKHESNYQVRVAQNDLQNADDPDERVLAVENVYKHSGHRPDLRQGQRNDIAMMRLKFRRGEPHGLHFSDYVQSLCVPQQNSTLVVGQECQISGWGLVDANHPKTADYVSRYLRGAVISILDPSLCRRAYGDRFDERLMICAGREEGGVDTCSGDSGGPLSCRDSFGRWFAAGIVSFGWECGAAGHPGVYTRVSAYLEFVHRTAAFLTGVEVV